MRDPKDISVLCVDDQASVRTVIKTALAKKGFRRIRKAEDGVSALKILMSESFDLIITDWNMPEIDGLKLFQIVQRNTTLQKTPVIMLTGKADSISVKQAVKAGVRFFLAKPVDPMLLYARINAALGADA